MSDCNCNKDCTGFGTALMVFLLFWKSCDNTIENKLESISTGETVVKCKVVE